MDMSEVRCFLQGIQNRGLTWRSYNSDVISDNTYASDVNGWQSLKTDIQTKCESEKFKRQLLRELRRMQEEDQEEDNNEDEDDDEKKKK